jgi:mannosyltransferase OCH1-like enzyme
MIPRLIHFVYCGGPLPDTMLSIMDTVRHSNPDWEYRFWDNAAIASEGLDYLSLLDKFKAPVHVSDYVRLLVVQKYGGIYLDCDVECVRPIDKLLKYEAFAAPQDGTGQICPAVFGAVPNHPWITWQLAHALDYSKPDTPWNVTLMTDAPRDGVTLCPTRWFYPFLWDVPKAERTIAHDTMLIHHWKGSWAPWVIRER